MEENEDFTHIDEICGFHRGQSQHAYYRLKERGVLRRITVHLSGVQPRYMSGIFEEVLDEEKFRRKHAEVLEDIIEEGSAIMDKYVLVSDTTAMDGIVYLLPVFEDGKLEKVSEKLDSLDIGVRTSTLVTTNVLVGRLCYRRFDVAYSTQQEYLENAYGYVRRSRVSYESV